MKTDTVKGFRDFVGKEAEKREKVREILVDSFEKYGFEAAETPVIEFKEFVKGDNSDDEAVSDIFKLNDRGKRDLALRYEFTFQLRRLMKGKKLPYKRYQIGPVFRDEPVSGNRLRQFIQCDVDTAGASIKDEAEILAVVNRVLNELKIGFVIYVNNRKLLNEILDKSGVKKKDFINVIRELDKLDKLSESDVKNNLKRYGAEKILGILKKPEKEFEKFESYSEIKELKKYCKLYNVKVKFLPSLARGLSYYNRTVFEVKSDIKEAITGGGSYMFNNVQFTGISFGLDRLAGIANLGDSNDKKVMVLSIGEDKTGIKVAEDLRNEGVGCVFSSAKIGKALEYANSVGIGKVVFVGSDEVKKGKYKIKDMKSGKEKNVSAEEIVKELRK